MKLINLDGLTYQQLLDLLDRVSVSNADKEVIEANIIAIKAKLFKEDRLDVHADIKAGQADIDDILS